MTITPTKLLLTSTAVLVVFYLAQALPTTPDPRTSMIHVGDGKLVVSIRSPLFTIDPLAGMALPAGSPDEDLPFDEPDDDVSSYLPAAKAALEDEDCLVGQVSRASIRGDFYAVRALPVQGLLGPGGERPMLLARAEPVTPPMPASTDTETPAPSATSPLAPVREPAPSAATTASGHTEPPVLTTEQPAPATEPVALATKPSAPATEPVALATKPSAPATEPVASKEPALPPLGDIVRLSSSKPRKAGELLSRFVADTSVEETERAEAYYVRAKLLRSTKRPAAALESFTRAVAIAPSSARYANGLAWALVTLRPKNLRDVDEALRHARRAVALSDRSVANYLDTLAKVLFEHGDKLEAYQVQQEAVDLAPNVRAFSRRLEQYGSAVTAD